MDAALFPRDFRRDYPLAVRGDGVYVYDAQGRKYLDAGGSAGAVTIGYGVSAVVDAMAAQARELPFVHSSQFHTPVAEALADHLRRQAPGPLAATSAANRPATRSSRAGKATTGAPWGPWPCRAISGAASPTGLCCPSSVTSPPAIAIAALSD